MSAPSATPDSTDEYMLYVADDLVDGHGRALYKVREDTARTHHEAVAAGWRHSCQVTPYQNLRALVEFTEADRREYRRVTFKFIAGLGPASTPLALNRLGVGR
jgi:hypothetical protein